MAVLAWLVVLLKSALYRWPCCRRRGVAKERIADGRVGVFGIVKKGKRSIGRIEAADGVQQERRSASGRILSPTF